MAKPKELSLTMEGKDAARFQDYIDNPTYPKEGSFDGDQHPCGVVTSPDLSFPDATRFCS
jgi:hypothetical protein